ncbi:MAG: IS3 family transposase [Treponema sp.]|nr:IS3 family transposase [Treponema sp.]
MSKKKVQTTVRDRSVLIERVHTKLPIAKQCELLGISRSAAYYKREHTVHKRDLVLLEHIRSILARLPFYGYRKVSRAIRANHMPTSEKQVRRIMKRAELQAIFPRRNLSKARQEHKKYPYLLAGKILRYPNQVWATDLTYIKLPSGHVYLMAIIDLYSRKVLNWIITNTLDTSIFANCLRETIERFGIPAIFNTDQGCQFTSECWTNVLHEYGVKISMDGKNRALDNIYVERIWKSLKYEDIYIKQYDSVCDLRQGIDRYFQFYNKERFHQGLDYQTPDQMYQSFQIVDLAEQAV